MKPKTITIFELISLLWARRKKKRAQKRLLRMIKHGYWYCAHCDKLHNRRVVEYQIAGGVVDSVCSLGKIAYMEYNPDLAPDEQYQEEDFEPMLLGKRMEDEL